MDVKTLERGEMLTRKQKNSNNKEWYKQKIDGFINFSGSNEEFFTATNSKGGIELKNSSHSVMNYHRDRMRINYDLYNGIIDENDFSKLIKPFGEKAGKVPGRFTNKDICSGKIKALLGLEMKRPFEWRVIAVNDEATSRKEKEYFSRIQDFVVNSIIEPIKIQLEQQNQEQIKGRELNPDEQQALQQKMQEELKAMTPPEVKKYMARTHQDPAEVMANQLLNYLIQKEDFFNKCNRIFKHGLLSAVECGWVGIINSEPVLKVINSKYLSFDTSRDVEFIEDGEWASYKMELSPSDIISHFNEELKEEEIKRIYSNNTSAVGLNTIDFSKEPNNSNTIEVHHCEWKSLKPIKFLDRLDFETGEIETLIVDEEYTLDKEFGDIKITTEWIPYKFEGYKINTQEPIYVMCREVPGQYKDLENLYDCKLSYVGVVYDNMNSSPTCPMDRMREFQYYYNVIMWKIESLMSSDKGKKLFMNYQFIPKNNGISLEKFMEFLEINGIGFLDTTEEGKKVMGEITNAVKEIDLSLISDIQKYLSIADSIKRSCGAAVGVPEEMEGQISQDMSVGNTNNIISSSSNVIEPIFEIHNIVKKNVLSALLQCAKVCYSAFPKKKLNYILDDLSIETLTLDETLLDSSVFGLFTVNSIKASQALEAIKQLSHAAMQNQRAELSDIIKIYKANTIQEAEELLIVAEQTRAEREQAMEREKLQAQKESEERQREFLREQHEMDKEKINLEYDRKKDLEITKQLILSMGFNEDKDLDKDGVPDVLEVAKHELNTHIKMREQDLKELKLQYEKEKTEEQLEQNQQKLNLEQRKIAQKVINN